MARPKSKPAEIIDISGNETQLLESQNVAAIQAMTVLDKFGDGRPYDPIRYEEKVKYHLNRSAEEMLLAGSALIVIREHTDNGEWGEFLDRVGLEERLTRRMIQAAYRFSGAEVKKLTEAAGTKTKLFELLVLDNEEIQTISQGGEAAGIDLDDVARMSTTELRKALRDAREEEKAKQKLIDDKNQKVDKLSAELEKAKGKVEKAKPDYDLSQTRQDVQGETYQVEFKIAEIKNLTERLREIDPDFRNVIGPMIQSLKAKLIDLAVTAQVDFENPMSEQPEWATPDTSKADKNWPFVSEALATADGQE